MRKLEPLNSGFADEPLGFERKNAVAGYATA